MIGHLQAGVRGVELGGSEWQEAVVHKRLGQVVLQVLQRALASHNGLQHGKVVSTMQSSMGDKTVSDMLGETAHAT